MLIPYLKIFAKTFISTTVVDLIYGLRFLMFFIVSVILSATLSLISCFLGIIYAIQQYQSNMNIVFDGILIFYTISFVFGFLIFIRLMSKKFWLKNLFIDEINL